jgi:hypothetical protein
MINISIRALVKVNTDGSMLFLFPHHKDQAISLLGHLNPFLSVTGTLNTSKKDLRIK